MKQNYEKVPGEEPADDATPPSQVTHQEKAEKTASQEPESAPAKTVPAATTNQSTTPLGEYNQKRRAYNEPPPLDDLSPAGVVRAYVVAVLHTFYDVPRDEADAAAETWQGKIGCQFLAIKSKGGFEKMFGKKHGFMLWNYYEACRAIKRREYREPLYTILWVVVGFAALLTIPFTLDYWQKQSMQRKYK